MEYKGTQHQAAVSEQQSFSSAKGARTFFLARYLRAYFCRVTAASWMRAWRAALAAAFLPAAVVRLKRVRTSHMRTQLCTTVALRFLHMCSMQICSPVLTSTVGDTCRATVHKVMQLSTCQLNLQASSYAGTDHQHIYFQVCSSFHGMLEGIATNIMESGIPVPVQLC